MPSVSAPDRRHPSRTIDQALAPVKAGLEAVSRRILSHLTDPVARNVVYLITAGGKRLRPALVLLCGACGPSPSRAALIDTATAVELIHTATLIHDDIIDQSLVRRSQPSFHARWGTERAVLMGDYLYATAFTLLARLEQPAVMQTMAEVCQQLCRGELREVEARFRLDLTEAEYFDIIRDKTASLVGGCCQSGALLGGCDAEAVQRLTAFGINFGLAFQIIDDCLDLTSDQQQLGKSVLADLDKGALSLPIIYLTQTMTARERDRLFAPLRDRSTDPAFLAEVAKAAAASGAIARAQERARALVQTARETLGELPIDGLQDAYDFLTDYAVSRRS
ncbi:MAG: polyprenyl synthetase family protein [Candidatus Omnitrophica bacterium]|nr:polyprenyl synthetase family protein [Candidatus Omnitrophota bacterium]